MVTMQTPLAQVMAAYQAQFPGQTFPGKATAVAQLSGTVSAAPAAIPPRPTTDTAAALTRLHTKIEDLATSTAFDINNHRIAVQRIEQRLAADTAHLDDRLTGEIRGVAGQVAGISAQVDRLAQTMSRPAIDATEQVAAAVREAFAPFRAEVEASGRVSEVLAVADALPTGESDALAVFGVKVTDARGNPAPVYMYSSPRAEAPDPVFIWTEEILRHLLLSQRTGENLWLGGEKGTGKSETVRQFAARTGREYIRINFHKYTTAEEIIGAVGLVGGGTEFVPGPFLRAYTTPGACILLDEITNADPGELAILNGLLEPAAAVTIGGSVWRRAPGVLIFAADNTLTNGDQSGRYSGTRQMNSALADRFARIVAFNFLPLDREVAAVMAHTGCNPDLARMILAAVTMARSKVHTGDIIDAPSIRSVIAFVRALDMMPVRDAWNSAIAARQPQESALALQGIFEACIDEAKLSALI